MKIGVTYDLKDDYLALGFTEHDVAEFDSQITIDAVCDALAALGHDVVRIGHVRALAARLVANERWDLVFNIAEGVAGFGRESQVPASAEVRTFLDAHRTALDLAEQFGARTRSNFEVDYAHDHELPDLMAPRILSTALYIDANVQLDAGRADKASARVSSALALAELNVETCGDLAFAHGLAHMVGTKTDGSKTDMWFRYTAALRRGAGTWKITHQHSSVPFYMDDAFKAALDLTP